MFKNREVLKEHMRKKGHKKINPSDSDYDRFYVINYKEFGKNWGDLVREDKQNIVDNDDDDDDDVGALNGFNLDNPDDASWDEWRGDPARITCLFCPALYPELADLLIHMTAVHDFDFKV